MRANYAVTFVHTHRSQSLKYDFSSVKDVFFGGRAVNDHVMEGMGEVFPEAAVWSCYGGCRCANYSHIIY